MCIRDRTGDGTVGCRGNHRSKFGRCIFHDGFSWIFIKHMYRIHVYKRASKEEFSMRLTVQTDYALRVLMHVALQNDDLVQIADIAKDFDISRNHLVKIVHLLSKRGYLKTVQGRNG